MKIKNRGIKAWLITRGPGQVAALKDHAEIIDILSARTSWEKILFYVQRLHDRSHLTLSERMGLARYIQKGEAAYKAELQPYTLPGAPKIGNVPQFDRSRSALIVCGHDPVYVARKVQHLIVQCDPETGEERLRWEPWRPGR
jgi:hypothetical protein